MKIELIFFPKTDFKTKGVDLFSLLLIFLTVVTILEAKELPIDKIKLPSGFSIEIFSDNVPNARSMIISDEGTIFVGTRDGSGKVYAILDNNGDYSSDTVITIDNNQNSFINKNVSRQANQTPQLNGNPDQVLAQW